jgi:hypothetical protein
MFYTFLAVIIHTLKHTTETIEENKLKQSVEIKKNSFYKVSS